VPGCFLNHDSVLTPVQINEGDGAFYGPKIDIGVFDALKRKFQCATLQVLFNVILLSTVENQIVLYLTFIIVCCSSIFNCPVASS
jgi:hypothetical protein